MMNTKYQSINTTPYRRSNFQPFKWVASTKNTTVDSRDSVEYVKPAHRKKKTREIDRQIDRARVGGR